jgi:hypothetical protein
MSHMFISANRQSWFIVLGGNMGGAHGGTCRNCFVSGFFEAGKMYHQLLACMRMTTHGGRLHQAKHLQNLIMDPTIALAYENLTDFAYIPHGFQRDFKMHST